MMNGLSELPQPDNEKKTYQNVPDDRPHRHFPCILVKPSWEHYPNRMIYTNEPDVNLPTNHISTTKYTLVTFIPKNLLEQFSRLANVYFLIVGLLQLIPAISTSNGQPLIFIPLSIIIAISAVKDLFEDMKRHRSDKEENNRPVQVMTEGGWVEKKWMDLRVGDLIMVKRNEYFPADVLLLNTVDSKTGICYVETKNLDGETNLKQKQVPKRLIQEFRDSVFETKLEFNYEKPNPYLYQFKGRIKITSGEEISLDNHHFVLRGCSLRNTDWVYGCVAYTGPHTKIMLNSVKPRAKQGKVERSMNRFIIGIFICQIVICLICAIMYTIWYAVVKDELPYLGINPDDVVDNAAAYNFFVRYGNWMLIFTNFVPISLLVTLEMVRFIQAIFILQDDKMKTGEVRTNVQSSNLNEEIGQIHHIFSDKTGTLTKNYMEFKKIFVGGISYGEKGDMKDEELRGRTKVTNVDFRDSSFFKTLDKGEQQAARLQKTLMHIAICHTIIVERPNGGLEYNASSPDELALVNWARFCGCEFQGLDDENCMTVSFRNQTSKHKLLHVLEFNSTRKRMSVIVRDLNSGEVKLLCKGADSIIFERLSNATTARENSQYRGSMESSLEEYGNIGLRTLVLAERIITQDEYKAWDARYHEASTAIHEREQRMMDVQEEIERELVLVGATAIEDKLQDEVGETIDTLKKAGVKVWVLTGDKIETAINIGFSCKLLESKLELVIIDGKSFDEVHAKLERPFKKHTRETTDHEYALIVSGDALIHMMAESGRNKLLESKMSESRLRNFREGIGNTRQRLVELGDKAAAVIACRVSPKQKQEIVSLVRQEKPEINTLAIGDGANDVNMIIAAHVGIGLKGVEGQQAARASDYSFGEFKHLRRLLLYYGRECYRRNTTLIHYNFFKNMVWVLPQFWYAVYNMFSAATLYDSYLLQFFNLLYASLPIIIFAVFDEEKPDYVLISVPRHYDLGRLDMEFTAFEFWKSVVNGALQAIAIAYISVHCIENNFSSPDGYNQNFYMTGLIAYTLCVIVVNIKIFLLSNKQILLNILIVIGSLLVYLISLVIFNVLSFTNLHLIFSHMITLSNFYQGVFLAIVATNFFDMAVKRFQYLGVQMKTKESIYDLPKKEEIPLIPVRTSSPPSEILNGERVPVLQRNNTGFAFSGGNDVQPADYMN